MDTSLENKVPVPENQEKREPGSFRLIFTLGLAGFISGLVMVSAYLFTKPLIEANKAATIERAIFKVLPNCKSYKTIELKEGKIAEYGNKAEKVLAKADPPQLAYMGFNENKELVGFAIPKGEIGFADVIMVMVGYNASKKSIIGYEVLESKETPGLGDKIFKDLAFTKNFEALLTQPEILFAKKGEKTKENEVEGITGATISSKAVVRLLNNAIKQWNEPLEKYLPTTDHKAQQ
ncbi:MAG: FMN-binding protein [Saprospiraceae bacterium]|nr:FMN-binding protein [Saprospiraceae bacterium]